MLLRTGMRRMNLSSIEQGELVVADIMFAEQSGKKRRLGLVLSNSEFNKNSKDVIVLKVTSSARKTEYAIQLENENTENKALKKESMIMSDFPVTLAKENILARPDKINIEKLREVKNKVKKIYGL